MLLKTILPWISNDMPLYYTLSINYIPQCLLPGNPHPHSLQLVGMFPGSDKETASEVYALYPNIPENVCQFNRHEKTVLIREQPFNTGREYVKIWLATQK